MLYYNSWRVVRITHKINGIVPTLPRVFSIHMINIFMMKLWCESNQHKLTHSNVYLE